MSSVTDNTAVVLRKAYKALKANPHDMQLHALVAATYEQSERYADARPHLKALWSAAPSDENLCHRYARSLQRAGELVKACAVLDEGLALFPSSVVLQRSRALTLSFLGEYEQAREVYRELHRRDEADQHSLAMAGMLDLLMTAMKAGFEEYARRPQEPGVASIFEPIPRWSGEDLAGKRIVLWSEQGIGDVVMFLSLVPWVSQAASAVCVVVTGKLVALLERSFPEVTVVSEAGLREVRGGDFDFQLPLGDLFHYVLPHYVPSLYPPYLLAASDTAARLREKYLAYAEERGRTRLVGLSWHTTNPHVGFTQNISLEQMAPILSVPGVQFVSLQYGDHTDDIERINRRHMDVLLNDGAIDAYGDMDGLAAQMSAMDEIISISNATVHLAGALGVPTTFLAPAMVDWRWGLKGNGSKWYSSVHVERQNVLLEWQPVLKRVRQRLLAAR